MRTRSAWRLPAIFPALMTLLLALPCPAAPPAREIPFSRKVRLAVPANYTFRFSLWDAAAGGEELWSEEKAFTLTGTTLKHVLGSVDPAGNPLDPAFFSRQLWVQVDRWKPAAASWAPVGARTRLNATPYALQSLSSEAGSITSVEILDGSVAGEDLQDGAALAEILDDDGAGSGLDADRVDGLHASELAGSAHEHDAAYVNEGQPGSVTAAMLADGAVTAAKIFPCAEGDVLVYVAGTWQCAALAAGRCNPGDMLGCYRGPAGTLDVGICRAGRRACDESGTGYGECLGEVLPTEEVCDGLDNDCDGQVDDDVTGAPTWYPDEDGDGYGDPGLPQAACTQPPGHVGVAGDCDDSRWSLSPDMGEICDGLDNDCDGTPDDLCAAAACSADEMDSIHECVAQCYQDPACSMGCVSGEVGLSFNCLPAVQNLSDCPNADVCFWLEEFTDPLDCLRMACPTEWAAAFGPVCEEGATRACGNDEGQCAAGTQTCSGGVWSEGCAGSVGPAPEICGNGLDEDCNGVADDPEACADADLDGWFAVNDCNDGDPQIHPGALEECNSIDDDCDEEVDEGQDLPGCQEYYRDQDWDGWGTATDTACFCPEAENPGWTWNPGDCDDGDPEIHPDADEFCNGLDDDCDGAWDEEGAWGCAEYYVDSDQDGWGGSDSRCLCQPEGPYTAGNPGDCDDGDPDVNPGAAEICNGRDDNCDGAWDDPGSSGCVAYYIDNDHDNYGNSSSCLCAPSWPYVGMYPDDCDDSNGFAYPGALEVCDSVDNDCDGLVDDDAAGCTPYYRDADLDSWGTSDYRCLCSADWPYAATRAGDCRDSNDMVYPGATEWCNGIDDDCDAATDEAGASGCDLHYRDADGDGRGNPFDALCLCAPGGGYVANNQDCDDTDPARYLGAPEMCDGLDNDCDGLTDPPGSGGCTGYWLDNDRDGYGRDGFGVCSCTPEPPYDTLVAGDCNDGNAAVNPGATEICGNGLDDDCVGGDEVCP